MLHRIRPRLVTFDITGTLLMTKLVDHYSEIALQHGLTISNNQLLVQSFKKNFARLEREHPVYGKHSGLGWKNWWTEIIYNVFKDQDNKISNELLEKVSENLIECYATNKCWEIYPGVVEILEYLQSRNMILGVISNFDERLDSILISTKLRRYFSFVLSSYTYGFEKPNSKIFEEALRRTMKIHGIDVKPEEAIHIGDTFDNDYIGATNAKWKAALVNHHEKVLDENKVPLVHQFTSLGQLQKYFESILNERM